MREVNGFFLFELGFIWQLAQIIPGTVKSHYLSLIGNCIYLLRSFVDDVYNKSDLPDSVAAARLLIVQLEQITQHDEQEITAEITGHLYHSIMQIRTLLMSELGKLTTILLEEKRAYSISALWKHEWKLFPEHHIVHLSDFVTINIGEAAKCLVLDCYTATGFHAMRAVECVARTYYEHITGNPPKYTDSSGKEREKGLGQIAQELIDKYTSLEHHKPKKSLSGNLGIIAITIQTLCKTYRDPLSHPEIVTLDENQAITTFTHAIEVISLIIEDAKNGGAHFVNPPTVVLF